MKSVTHRTRSRQPLSEATAFSDCRSRGLHHRPTPTPHYDESLEDEFLQRESLKKNKNKNKNNAPPTPTPTPTPHYDESLEGELLLQESLKKNNVPPTPTPNRSSEARPTPPPPATASRCSGVPPHRLPPTTTSRSSTRSVDRKRSQPNSRTAEELPSATNPEASGANGGEESVESCSDSSADVRFVGEHPEPSFHGSWISVNSRAPTRVSVPAGAETGGVNVKEESESVGGSGSDVPENDGDGESPDRTGYVSRALGNCIAGRTRMKAGTRDRVSYFHYFDKDDTEGSEEEEEEEVEKPGEEDSAHFAVADDSMTVSEEEEEEDDLEKLVKKTSLGFEVDEVESRVNVEDDKSKTVSEQGDFSGNVKAETMSHEEEPCENLKAEKSDTENGSRESNDTSETVSQRGYFSGNAEAEPASRVGEPRENLEAEKFDAARARAESSSVKADESDTVSQRGGIEFDVKKKEYGAPILVSLSNTEKASSERKSSNQTSRPARRTHSRPILSSSEKSKKLGTVENPLCLDEDEPEAKADSGLHPSDDKREEETESRMDVSGAERKGEERFQAESTSKKRKGVWTDPGSPSCNAREWLDLEVGNRMNMDIERERITKRRVQMGSTSKRSRGAGSLKGDDLFKILTDTIWNDDKKIPEESVKEKSPMNGANDSQVEDWQILLPTLFSFGDENQEQAQKTEDEKEIDELWADFDFALAGNNIGTYHDDEDQTDEISEAEMEYDPSNSCSKGKHQFILDEQIGFICKFCSFVKVHIRDIMPSWASHFGERSTRKTTFNEEGPFIFNDLHSTGIHGCQSSFRSPSGTIWDLPGVDKSIFPHQREAVEFMWRNLAGSIHLDKLKSGIESDGTGGCVISHAPGTGKTRTAIIFIQTYMKVFPECRPVIFAPGVMLQGWKGEIKKWGLDISVHNLSEPDYSGEEDEAVLKLVGEANQDIKFKRMVKFYSWDKGNSVILLTYNLFTAMIGHEDVEIDQKLKQLKKILLEKPNLIIFDEGHIPRNDHSAVFKALKELQTSKRIILTGTPFQNNFKELYNILWLVRPKFAESKTSTLSRESKAELLGGKGDCSFWERNEGKDKWATLTKNITGDRSITDDKTVEELKTIIEPFVHVYNGKVLDNLPGSTECVIVLDPVPLQHKYTIGKMQAIKSRAGLENDYRISLAAIHPFLVTFFTLSDAEKTLIDTQSLGKLRLNPDDGVKTKFVIELIRLSESLKEKVLVFCHNLEPLDMLKDQLIKLFNWAEGKEVLRMVGKIPLKFRHASIDMFNDLSSEARVMLASTKACAEGISLVGASRVILLDVEWNPSVERQAISRAYRLGQTRFVYIYHLITYGTGEAEKYGKQTKKDQWSKLVFSPEIDFNNIKASSSRAEKEKTSKFIAEDKILEEMTGNEKLKDMFIKICYQPKESNIRHVFTTDDQNPTGN